MGKVFALRIDIESDKGIKFGLPKILCLLKKYNLKASFYLTMGGESNLFELLKYRKKLKGERKIKVFSFLEKLRMIFFPGDFVKNNHVILKRILDEGHELGIHGWKHRAWTRGLEKIDIKMELIKAINKYQKIFGRKPVSFSAPGFNTNREVIRFLERQGLKVISDLPGEKPFKIKDTKIINIPITLKGRNNSPLIESLAAEGYGDEEILKIIKKEIMKRNLSTLYGHCLFECIKKIKLMEDLFIFLLQKDIKVKRIEDIA